MLLFPVAAWVWLAVLTLRSEAQQPPQCTLTTDDCKNKYCKMMESFFSCEVYPFGWEEICAEYIVGALFPCPALPSPDELTEAPSVCLQDLLSMVSLANPNNTLDIMPGANHSEDCYVECYQTYLINALDFYDSCTGELSSLPPDQCKVITNPELPLATMQTYRAQTCSFNEDDSNCLDPIIQQFGANTSGQPDLFDYSCPLTPPEYEYLASQFALELCCFANQNAVLMSINQVYPPCFMNYMTTASVPADATYFCVNGTLRDMGTIEISVNMKFNQTNGLPDMNSETSTQMLRGSLMTATNVSGVNPSQITVIKYTYYSDDAQTVSVSSVSEASSGVFTCLVMISSASNSTWSSVADAMASPSYAPIICSIYQQRDVSLCTVSIVEDDYFEASPFDLSEASSYLIPSIVLYTIATLTVFYLL